MWPKSYKDYPVDSPLKKERREPSQGIVGCEMHESNGWGESYHIPTQTPGRLSTLFKEIKRWFGS